MKHMYQYQFYKMQTGKMAVGHPRKKGVPPMQNELENIGSGGWQSNI